MLPKHINCRGSITQSQQYDAAKAYQLQRQHSNKQKRRITETLQQPGSQHGQSRSIKWRGYENAEDIGTPQTKITETSLQKDSNANQKHANPYISPHITHQTCSIKSISIAAETRCTQTRQETTQMEKNGRPQSKKLFNHNQRGEFGDNCTIMMPRDRIDKIPTPVAAERHMCHG
jgi:thiol:disulfide interchange protein